jgi:hypothetical protein
MDLTNLRVKLDYLFNLVESEGPKRTVLAEIDDARRIVLAEEIKVTPFPLSCECELKDTNKAHTKTSRAIAEQAYANYARHNGRSKTLDDFKKAGGFGCIEIRMLLAGLKPDEFTKDEVNGKVRLNAFLKTHQEIKL